MEQKIVDRIIRLTVEGETDSAINLLARLSRQARTFDDLVEKHKWLEIPGKTLAQEPGILQNLFDLVQTAYKPLGGNYKIKEPSDILKEMSFIIAINLDDDPEADAALMGKQKGRLVKLTSLGHDDLPGSKKEVVRKWVELSQQGKAYAEVSGPAANILLKKMWVPIVTDPKKVKRVLGKPIQWVGEHPDGKYPGISGWYYRNIAGHNALKILIGKI